jgi:hypothetical protein
MKKNINIKAESQNLLNNAEFKDLLNFESEYANAVKGGHFPNYYGEEKQRRLVNEVNLLSSQEQTDLVYNFFIGKN